VTAVCIDPCRGGGRAKEAGRGNVPLPSVDSTCPGREATDDCFDSANALAAGVFGGGPKPSNCSSSSMGALSHVAGQKGSNLRVQQGSMAIVVIARAHSGDCVDFLPEWWV